LKHSIAIGIVLCSFLLLPFAILSAAAAEDAAQANSFQPVTLVITNSSPKSAPNELLQRFGRGMPPQGYHVGAERFEAVFPPDFTADRSHGLLVWIGPGDSPKVPAAWRPVIAAQKLVFVAAYESGNKRDVFDRFRLALDAAEHLRSKHQLDSRRIYVAGFSGGGRVASMLGIAYPDLFAGTMAVCGVDFCIDVPASEGRVFRRSFQVQPAVLQRAKNNSFVLITGEKDFNRVNTQSVYHWGFQQQKFQRAHLLDVPGLKHGLPETSVLEKALELLDNRPAENHKEPRR
jgi:hypothetical protein